MNNTDLAEKTNSAAKKFFDGIRNGLSEEESFNQHVFGNKTVRDICEESFYLNTFNKTPEEIQYIKSRPGKLPGEEAREIIALYFKNTNNAWATAEEIKLFMTYIFGKTENSLWGHIQRMNEKYGLLEHDEINHCYRLSKKWFEQQ